MGSTRVARSAGKAHAATATSASIAASVVRDGLFDLVDRRNDIADYPKHSFNDEPESESSEYDNGLANTAANRFAA